MKKLLAFLLFLPLAAHAANTPPSGTSGDIQYNNAGKFGPYVVGNGLVVTTSGSTKFLNSTATGGVAPAGAEGAIQFNSGGSFGGYTIGSGLGVVGGALTATTTTIPGGAVGSIQYNNSGVLGGYTIGPGLAVSGGALTATVTGANVPAIGAGTPYQYLTNDGTNTRWAAPASLIDPRTYGAACVGPGYSGGLTSGSQGILLTNAGSGYTNGTYTTVPLTGGAGTGAQATIVVAGGIITTVTITAAGINYKLHDQLSALASNLGGTGSGFQVQVAHFSSNKTPVYDGVHDDSAAFQKAFAAAQNTGQGVLVPDGCWVAPTSTPLTIPQGICMVGEGYSPAYGYNFSGGTADASPVLYVIGHPNYALKMGFAPNNCFMGFELNGQADGSAFNSTIGIGSDVSTGGGSPAYWIHYMSFKNMFAGTGTLNGATLFLHSDHSDYGTNQWGIYGNESDLDSLADTFPSMGTGGIYLFGGAGEVRINQARFEFSPIGIRVGNYGSIFISNSQCDHESTTCLLLDSTSQDIYIDNMNFQASGSTKTSGHEAHITLSRTTTSPLNLQITNSNFTTEGEGYPKYILESTTTGSMNDHISINGGSASTNSLGPAYTVNPFNFLNGRPTNISVQNVNGMPNEGGIANGNYSAQARGLPTNQWSGVNVYGDASAFNEQQIPLENSFGALVAKQLGTGPTYNIINDFSHFDCDVVDTKLVPNTNPGLQGQPVQVFLPSPGNAGFGGGFYQGHLADLATCHMGGIAWATVPADYKVNALSFTTSGTWSTNTHYTNPKGITSSTLGDTATGAITTYGGPIYLGYLMNGSNGGTFQWTLDGTTTGSVATQGSNSWAFPNDSTKFTMGAVRIPVNTTGSHSIGIALTSTTSVGNTVTPLYLATPPGKGYASTTPTFVLGGQIQDGAQPASANAQNNSDLDTASTMFADGLHVLFADVQKYFNTATDVTTFGSSNLINAMGQGHLADAFNAVIQGVWNSGNYVNPLDFGASCNTTYFPTSYNGATSYSISTTNGSAVISIANYAFQPGVATQFGGGDVGKRICIFEGDGTVGLNGDVGPCTYIASVNTAANTATLGATMKHTGGGQGLITGYPSNPLDPSTAQDDTNAIQLASQAAQKGSGKVFLPNHCAVHNLQMADTTLLEGNAGGNYYLTQGLGPQTGTEPQAGPTVLYCALTGYPNDENVCINVRGEFNSTVGNTNTAYKNFMLQGIVFPYSPYGISATGIGYAIGSSLGHNNDSEATLIEHVSFMNLPVHIGEALGWNQPVTFTAQITGTTMEVSAITSTNISIYGGTYCPTSGECVPEFLAVGRPVTGAGVTANTTIVTAPPAGRLGTYTVSVASTTSSETMTSAANTGAMTLRARWNQHQTGVVAVNGDFTDSEWTGNVLSGAFLKYGMYIGPNRNGFGNGSNRVELGRIEVTSSAAIICDSCGLDMTGVDLQFNGGFNIQTKGTNPTVNQTGGHMYAGGHNNTPVQDKAMIQLGGTNAHVAVNGVILTTNDVHYGGTTTYLFSTATGATGATASVVGGNAINNETVTGLYNWTNGQPAKYAQDVAGWPVLDTFNVPTTTGLSLTSTSGGYKAEAGLAGTTTVAGTFVMSNLPAALNGYNCQGGDYTIGNNWAMFGATTSTSCSMQVTTSSGNSVWFGAQAR